MVVTERPNSSWPIVITPGRAAAGDSPGPGATSAVTISPNAATAHANLIAHLTARKAAFFRGNHLLDVSARNRAPHATARCQATGRGPKGRDPRVRVRTS